jgi:hypothetical protein
MPTYNCCNCGKPFDSGRVRYILDVIPCPTCHEEACKIRREWMTLQGFSDEEIEDSILNDCPKHPKDEQEQLDAAKWLQVCDLRRLKIKERYVKVREKTSELVRDLQERMKPIHQEMDMFRKECGEIGHVKNEEYGDCKYCGTFLTPINMSDRLKIDLKGRG